MTSKYREAPFDRRVKAKITDVIFAFFASAAVPIAFAWAPGFMRIPIAILAVLFIPLYLLLADGLQGQSVGKRLFGLKVVDYQTGSPCTFFQSFVRNIAGLGFLRILTMAEEEGSIEEGNYKGPIVIDVSTPKNTTANPGQTAPEPPKPARLDLEGIADFARRKKDPEN